MATAFQKTYSAKLSEIKKDWWVIDATDIVLGRMSAEVAKLLMGKHKPTYTPHMDCGDNVIIINADKIHLTGKKVLDKTYYWHTNYPGGIKSTTAGKVLDGEHPERVVIKAIERMITRGPLGRERMRNLHVYASAEHPHAAQQPKEFKLDTNPKNSKR